MVSLLQLSIIYDYLYQDRSHCSCHQKPLYSVSHKPTQIYTSLINFDTEAEAMAFIEQEPIELPNTIRRIHYINNLDENICLFSPKSIESWQTKPNSIMYLSELDFQPNILDSFLFGEDFKFLYDRNIHGKRFMPWPIPKLTYDKLRDYIGYNTTRQNLILLKQMQACDDLYHDNERTLNLIANAHNIIQRWLLVNKFRECHELRNPMSLQNFAMRQIAKSIESEELVNTMAIQEKFKPSLKLFVHFAIKIKERKKSIDKAKQLKQNMQQYKANTKKIN